MLKILLQIFAIALLSISVTALGSQDKVGPTIKIRFTDAIPVENGEFNFEVFAELREDLEKFVVIEVMTPNGLVVVPEEIHGIFLNPDLSTLRLFYGGKYADRVGLAFRHGPVRRELAKKLNWSVVDTRARSTLILGGGRVLQVQFENPDSSISFDDY